MNRQPDPMVQHEGQVDVDAPASVGRVGALPRPAGARPRTTPAQFLRDVRGEMRKVAWPKREEVVNYSIVVFVTLVIIVALIFGLNLAFQQGVTFLLQP
ncbi:MAG: preprotein translocase subunit SecE [Acidimicrobiales bacterium]